jgi:hypothetical protein
MNALAPPSCVRSTKVVVLRGKTCHRWVALSGAAEAKKVAPAVPLREKRLVLMRREDESPAMERLYHAFGSMVGAAIFASNALRSVLGGREGLGSSFEGREKRGERRELWTAGVDYLCLLYFYFDSGVRLPPSLCISTLTDGFR